MSKRDLVSKLNKSRSNVIKLRVTIMIVRLTQARTFWCWKLNQTKKKKGSKEVLQAIHIFKYQAIDFDNNSYVVYMLYICCVYEKIHLHFVFDWPFSIIWCELKQSRNRVDKNAFLREYGALFCIHYTYL